MLREAFKRNVALDPGSLAEAIMALEDFPALAAKAARGGEAALRDIAAGDGEAAFGMVFAGDAGRCAFAQSMAVDGILA